MKKGIKEKPKLNDTIIAIGLPNEICMDLVSANEVKQYEIFEGLTAIFASIAAGFWTGWLTTGQQSPAALWSALAFTFSTLVFLGLTIKFRSKVFKNTIKRQINFNELK